MPWPYRKSSVGYREGFRSGLEDKVAKQLEDAGVEFQYEKMKIAYTLPETNHKYTPDFVLTTRTGKQIIVETKGRFLVKDRQKHLAIKKQYPDADIRLVFERSSQKISKGSKTSYGDWADAHGIPYADKLIPKEWLDE